jgi:hypothetical protein
VYGYGQSSVCGDSTRKERVTNCIAYIILATYDVKTLSELAKYYALLPSSKPFDNRYYSFAIHLTHNNIDTFQNK